MWQYLKSLLSFGDSDHSDVEDSVSIQKLVTFNSLNKRKNIRIQYPHFGGGGPFPRAFYLGTEMIVANISVGGILIIDDTEAFGTSVGEVLSIELAWDDFKAKIKARVVSANLRRRHLQFTDFNAQSYLRISRLVKPGYLGTRFHLVKDDSGTLQADELWLGPTGESVAFFEGSSVIEINIQNRKISLNLKSDEILIDGKNEISNHILEDILIVIASFGQVTPRIKSLMEAIEQRLRNPDTYLKTGSHG